MSLPLYVGMPDHHVARVVGAIRDLLGRSMTSIGPEARFV
jgi:hypothetical protein